MSNKTLDILNMRDTPFPSNVESLLNTVRFFNNILNYSLIMIICTGLVAMLFNKIRDNSNIGTTYKNTLKYYILGSLIFFFSIVIIKLIFKIKTINEYSLNMNLYLKYCVNMNYRVDSFLNGFNGTLFSDVIVLLSYFSGLFCMYLLGDRDFLKSIANVPYFCIFIVITNIMVYTENLLVMFLSFEFIFLPTIYFAYSLGYVKKSDKAAKILLYWTLTGAFLVLCSLAYIYSNYKTLNYTVLVGKDFSNTERYSLMFLIFLGFGSKMPITPLHYWLTKVHVEAPAGFSIFLSGFLVKAALYCFYYFYLIFKVDGIRYFIIFITIGGFLEASVKMWNQTDFKKLIAFATIQEMNLILLFLVVKQNTLTCDFVVFIILHGLLSMFMFFLVDVLQRRLGTRNIAKISGLVSVYPELVLAIWLQIFFYVGFPLTIKFAIELQIIQILMEEFSILACPIILGINVIGALGFCKVYFSMIYGSVSINVVNIKPLTSKERYLLELLGTSLILLFFLGTLVI